MGGVRPTPPVRPRCAREWQRAPNAVREHLVADEGHLGADPARQVKLTPVARPHVATDPAAEEVGPGTHEREPARWWW